MHAGRVEDQRARGIGMGERGRGEFLEERPDFQSADPSGNQTPTQRAAVNQCSLIPFPNFKVALFLHPSPPPPPTCHHFLLTGAEPPCRE